MTEGERRLADGQHDLSAPPAARDAGFDTHDWSEATVRAAFLKQWMLSLPGEVPLEVRGARVSGALDLTGARIPRRVTLARCVFDEPMILQSAQIDALDLSGSELRGFYASNLRCEELRLDGRTVVRGRLAINAGEFGFVTLAGILIENPGELALDANVTTTRRSFEMNRMAHVRGNVRFIGASIGGQLNFRNCLLEGNLSLHETTTARALYLMEGVFKGRVRLSYARIGGHVNGTDASFLNPDGLALDLDNLTVARSVAMPRITVRGLIRMRGGRIDGLVRFTRAVLVGTVLDQHGDAEDAAGWAPRTLARIDEHLDERVRRLTDAFEPLASGRYESNPICGRVALLIERSVLDLDLDLDLAAMAVDGAVVVTGTTIRKRLDAKKSEFRNPGGIALDLSHSIVGQALRWREVTVHSGRVVMSHLHVVHLDDDPGSWPMASDLHGLTYDSVDIDRGAWTLAARIEWLRRARHSSRQYETFANVLLAAGRRDNAWEVLHAAARQRRQQPDVSRVAWLTSGLRGALVGHGYRPEFAAGWLLLLILASAVIYEVAWRRSAFVARDAKAVVEGRCIERRPCFNPFMLSLDAGLPIVDLGANDDWSVDGETGAWAQHVLTAETLIGWALATAGVAGLTRRAIKS